jgi:acetyl/propionyl-CoA carboxylase alpha subunit/acetyl-CoA carboxylase carboxyltransferase component
VDEEDFMTIKCLLIANRGEIAIRIATAAAELGIPSVSVYSEDDASSLHTRKADRAEALKGRGAGAYLDGAQIIEVAKSAGANAIHPGYGFLSENAGFARACEDSGLIFVGPQPSVLELFGDKAAARKLAEKCGVPLLPGLNKAVSLDEAEGFFKDLQAKDAGAQMIIKAIHGGGGRGMRLVSNAEEIASLYERCQSEAKSAFGNNEVYVEKLIAKARHIEVQVVGDGSGSVIHLGERECSLQRRHQKIVEIAPAPFLPTGLRDRLFEAAIRMAETVRYVSLGTFEFLVDATSLSDESAFAFIEANARLQVEHTVTEEVLGVDLVKSQIEIASGKTLSELGLETDDGAAPRGFAIQARVNMEVMQADGTTKPTGGTLSVFEPPSGPGIRVDTFGYSGYTTSPSFDSLLAKQITWSGSSDFKSALTKAYRSLCEFRIEGVETNLSFLQNLLKDEAVADGAFYTRFVDDHVGSLVVASDHSQLFHGVAKRDATGKGQAGASIDGSDPLAVLAHGKSGATGVMHPASAPLKAAAPLEGPEGTLAIPAPLQGTIVSLGIEEGSEVHEGAELLVMEAMKMEHVIIAPTGGIVRRLGVAAGDTIYEGHPLIFIEPGDVDVGARETAQDIDLDHIRPDLHEVYDRHAFGLDENRPEAVTKRRKISHRTARENIIDLCDDGSFVEYGSLALAAQRRRRSMDDLIKNTPGDGMVAGVGSVNGDLFDEKASQVVAMSYDYTVLAGTQGLNNHKKKDRMFEIAEKQKLPVIFFTEGGGGRPGDTDGTGVAGLDCMAFHYFGRLSGLVPLVGVNAGRCFAGNASLLGCCDVIIATEDSTIGMGGPAMIEGGNLGIYRPEEVGPMSVQVANGVVDIAVKDEKEAVQVAKKYISYFQGNLKDWESHDQRELRTIIPENRLRIYDVREVIEIMCDVDSVLEIRRGFGPGMVTCFGRMEGRPLGIIANNPEHLAGAVTSDGADKAARFMQLCDAYDIPILMLCDTPGIMVGPEAEKTALVRHANRLFVTGGSLTVPFFTIILRKAYGLGAQAMAGGSFRAPIFSIAWPTGEIGGMGLEGAVKLGYRNELAAIEDSEERKATFDTMVAASYERGKAINAASHLEFDDVIDPRDSRHWIMSALKSSPAPLPREGKKRPMVDTW